MYSCCRVWLVPGLCHFQASQASRGRASSMCMFYSPHKPHYSLLNVQCRFWGLVLLHPRHRWISWVQLSGKLPSWRVRLHAPSAFELEDSAEFHGHCFRRAQLARVPHRMRRGGRSVVAARLRRTAVGLCRRWRKRRGGIVGSLLLGKVS